MNTDDQSAGGLRRGIGKLASRVADWAATRHGTDAVTGPDLAPLTPEFDPDQHSAYVGHLNAAIDNPKIRNIALTGRYGSGKSSVLEAFARQRQTKHRILFLALSTLGPDQPGETRTNQIEKELVKQLLHRERPSRLPQSRYQRIEGLSRWRAAIEAAAVLASVGVALWLFGVFPSVPGLSGDHSWVLRIGAVVISAASFLGVLVWVRLTVHNRLVVSEVSAAGASISLTGAGSYFDEYLDEIVYFFETMRDVDLAVFEDLDRFDDPGIFEALRELNTLLNSSKQMGGKTVRFVYALRDSIFEKLGHDASSDGGDAAHDEAVRANRTKFFDLVVPIVPFITHRTSRDLLTRILSDEGRGEVAPVSDELIDLTARHLPDMRLLTNIRNEYTVFAQRLITEKRGVESLEADQLFALVVYKNVHLSDFERVLLGRSQLDTLYKLSRGLVTESIDSRRAQLRRIADEVALPKALARKAERWGEQLAWFVESLRGAKSTRVTHSLSAYEIAGTDFNPNQVGTAEFWQALVTAAGVTAKLEAQGTVVPMDLSMDDLRRLLGGALPGEGWDNAERAELARERARLEAELEILRTADFKELARREEFTLMHDDQAVSFKTLLLQHIDSEVGRAMITEGFIDRYYTLYVAQYYGDHVPPNAMNFIVQNVDTNRSDVNYRFNNDGEIAAVLRETKRLFLSDASAYNIGLLDYLLAHADSGAATVLDAVTRHVGGVERAFLGAYLADGAQTAAAVAYLAGRWSSVFTELITETDISHQARLDLVNVALANSNPDVQYVLDDAVRDFLQSNYQFLSVVTRSPVGSPDAGADTAEKSGPLGGAGAELGAPADEQIRRAVATLRRAGVVCDDLGVLNREATRLIVEGDCYTLTAANLRTALGDPATLSLDRVRAMDRGVYDDCLENPDDYLAAIANDIEEGSADGGAPTGSNASIGKLHDLASTARSRTAWTIEDPTAFIDVVRDLGHAFAQPPVAVISLAHPKAVIDQLDDVPKTVWRVLAQTRRFRVTVANVDAYINFIGELDSDLASVLEDAGQFTVAAGLEGETNDSGETDVAPNSATGTLVATAILNAATLLPDPATRVRLVASMALEDWLPVAGIQPETGTLLGLLIAEQICDDEPTLFAHFATGDWETLSYAIGQSTKFADFMTPELLAGGMTSQLLDSDEVKPELKQALLGRFDEFIDTADHAALSAAGRAALATDTPLACGSIAKVAAGARDADLVVRLLHQLGTTVTADEIVETLRHLASPYSELANPGAKLTFPRTKHHEAVLKRLHATGRVVARVQKGGVLKKPRVDVTVI